MRIFTVVPIFYVLFPFAAALGTILTSDLGGTTNGRKNAIGIAFIHTKKIVIKKWKFIYYTH